MMYQFYQAQADTWAALQAVAQIGTSALRGDWMQKPGTRGLRHIAALRDTLDVVALTHARPDFAITECRMGNATAAVTEHVVIETPFCRLIRFSKQGAPPQPRVLVVAPMSGHFATLLRGTVLDMLPDHEVFITDWINARDIPTEAGVFGFDEYVEHVIAFMETMGPRGHVVAVCQPTVAVLAAVAVMSEAANPATPRSMTLMAGPIDTRVNPTKVNELAQSRPIEWFRRNLIATVPWRYRGAHRRVYPGFIQLASFVSMNLDRHLAAHLAHFRNIVDGDLKAAEAHRSFYDEYNAVMDLTAEFFLETVERIFQRHDLPLGQLTWHGQPVRPESIRRTALLTVEGERDDICAIGQTVAALDLCAGVKPAMKRHHLQTGVGHYGVFNGKRWRNEIYPLVREMVEAMQ